jgi:predicted DNA-binding WGR domain protein
MHRFYRLFITPCLFDDGSLVKEWGGVGSPGTVKKAWFTMEQAAVLASQKISGKKIKKGYYLKPAEAIITDVIIDL